MRKTLICTSLALMLSACSTSRGTGTPLETWQNFKSSAITTQNLGDNHSLVVFFRQDDIQGPAVNVYVNGTYQASLLPNAMTPIAVCANNALLSSSFSSNTAFGNRTSGVQASLPAKEIAYIKVVQQANGQLGFMQVSSQDAERALANLPKENQTLSRVPAPGHCDNNNVVLASETLDASALFAFNKSGSKDISAEGKQSIQEFAQRLPSLGNVTKVTVAGHTDTTGNKSYNQALSQKRAETVKKLLKSSGVVAPIEAIGYGETMPVVTGCDALKGNAKHKCNKPNRRVEITATGNQ